MTRKDYELIAKAIRDCSRSTVTGELDERYAAGLAQVFARELGVKPTFDAVKFCSACITERPEEVRQMLELRDAFSLMEKASG